MTKPHILVVDGMNFLHRARSGWNMGPAPVIFNFMRNFKALVERFSPTRVYFVLEGKPQQRIDVLPEYKANRKVDEASPEAVELKRFYSQVDEIVNLLALTFPVVVVRHPRFECDDTIYNLVKKSSTSVDVTIVSNDSDFVQILNEFTHVKIWNPMKKSYVATPEYDYVTWKSLRGDASDNIPGIPGIGDKSALEIVNDPDRLEELFKNPDAAATFTRNYELIKFIEWSDEDMMEMGSSVPSRNWERLKETFEKYGFKSLIRDERDGWWDKFTKLFDTLWLT